MRTRTTWQGKGSETARQAATHRRADIYDMNYGGPRPQPTPDQYMAPGAGPDAWAESPASYDHVAEEYDSKGHVLRNDIGMAEFRKNTFDRPAWGDAKKYDNRTASERKAVAAHRLASTLLKTTDRDLVRKVALGFMALPDSALASSLSAVEQVSPKSLPEVSRFKRAFACTKLAANMLGDGASEASVERLARSIYEIDDPTLRSIVKSVAMAKIAQEQEEQVAEEEEQQVAEEEEQQVAEEEEEEQAPPAHKASGHKSKMKPVAEEEEEEEEQVAEEEEEEEQQAGPAKKKAGGFPNPKHLKKKAEEEEEEEEDDLKKDASSKHHPVAEEEEEEEEEGSWASDMLKHAEEEEEQMMGDLSSHKAKMKPLAEEEEEEEECGPSYAEEEEEEEDGMAPLDPATSNMLKGMQPPAPAAGLSGMMPQGMAPVAASLEALFADDPEVQAQREIVASGFGQSVGRTASVKGAKKLGKVQASGKASAESLLSNLWDRT